MDLFTTSQFHGLRKLVLDLIIIIISYDKCITPWEMQEMAKADKSTDYLAD